MSQPPPNPVSPHRLLLIEDKVADAVLLRDDLELVAGAVFEVQHCVCLAEGLDALRGGGIALVLLDLSLPDSHGIEGLERIQRVAPEVAVVVMTGLDDEELGARLVRGGAQDYLVKGKASAESVARVIRYAIQRQATENELRRFADGIVEHVPIGIAVLRGPEDGELRVVAANTALARLLGQPLRDLAGRPAARLFPGAADTAVPTALTEVLQTAEPRLLGDLPFGGGDAARVLSARVFPMQDGMAGLTLEDVTARRQAEAAHLRLEHRLQQADKMQSLGVLAGGIAHDFNNLLQVIMGNLELAMRELDPDVYGVARIEQAREASARAAELTRQMLVYAGRGAVEVAPLDLSELVEGFTHLLGLVVTDRSGLEYDLAPEMPMVLGDAAQLRRALANLVENAADALSECGQGRGHASIAVRTGVIDADRSYLAATVVDDDLPPGRYAFLEVCDQGCGMDDATATRIFDPFFTTKITGRGLGLASVLGIIRRHHGAVRVDSAKGGGTTFRLLLPCTDETRSRRPISPQERPGRQCPLTILVVDDEPLVRELAALTLERQSYHVLGAADGVEAVETFTKHADEIDAVLLDLTMPRMDGATAFKAIRAVRPDVPVILATGYGEEAGMDAVADATRAAVLQKPYQPQQLLGLLTELVYGQR